MDPIEPWIDAEAVRRMAHQLTAPVGKPVPKQSVDPGFGPGFEGFIEPDDSAVAPPAEASVAAPPREEGRPQVLPQSPARDVAPSHRQVQPEALVGPDPQAPAPEARPQAVAKSVPVVTQHSNDEAKPFLMNQPSRRPQAVHSAESSGERGPLVARMERFRQWLAEKVDARGMFVLDREGNPVVDDPIYGKLHFLARSLAQAYRPADNGAGNVHVKIGSDAYLAVVPVETDFGALVLGTVLPKPLEASAVDSIAKALEQSLRPERR